MDTGINCGILKLIGSIISVQKYYIDNKLSYLCDNISLHDEDNIEKLCREYAPRILTFTYHINDKADSSILRFINDVDIKEYIEFDKLGIKYVDDDTWKDAKQYNKEEYVIVKTNRHILSMNNYTEVGYCGEYMTGYGCYFPKHKILITANNIINKEISQKEIIPQYVLYLKNAKHK